MFKKLTRYQKECVIDFAVGFTIGLGCCGIGYAIGQLDAIRNIGKGIEKCCKADPTLTEHIWNALEKARSLQK